MSGISYNTLVTQIRNYTEVDSNVFTTDVLESFILNAQQRIMMDLPMDSDRFVDQGTMATDVNNIRVPAGALFIRGVEVFNATNSTEQGTWLERRDQTFLTEYLGRLTGPEGSTASGADVTGKPKYYSMFGGATGLSDTTSGSIYLAPTPDVNYIYRIYYNKTYFYTFTIYISCVIFYIILHFFSVLHFFPFVILYMYVSHSFSKEMLLKTSAYSSVPPHINTISLGPKICLL